MRAPSDMFRTSLFRNAAFLFAALFATPSSAEPMTLEAALAAAYLSNPQLEAQRAALRATDEEVAKSLSGWRPSIGGAASYGWQHQSQTLLGPGFTTSIPESEQLTLSQP